MKVKVGDKVTLEYKPGMFRLVTVERVGARRSGAHDCGSRRRTNTGAVVTAKLMHDKYAITVSELRKMLEHVPHDAVIRFTLGQTTPLVFWESWPSDGEYRMTFREDNR